MKQKKKQIFSLLLVAVMLLASALCMFPVGDGHTAHADDGTTCTNHSYENGFCVNCDAYEPAMQVGTIDKVNKSSSSTMQVPVYQVINAGQLYWIADKINEELNADYYVYKGCDIVIADDIYINENLVSNGILNENNIKRAWNPLSLFEGHIRGNGYSISGLYIKSETDGNTGFVNSLGAAHYDGKISNLNIFDSWFEKSSGKGSIAPLVGISSDASIENCYVDAVVKGINDVGGIVGTAINNFNISNCCFAGNVYGLNDEACVAGGILGALFQTNATLKSDVVIKNCSVTGTVEKVGSKDINVGILSGSGYNFTLINCHWDSAKNSGISFIKASDILNSQGGVIVNGILEQTNCSSKTATEFANGTICEENGRHISHKGTCLLCNYNCNSHEYEDGACKTCGCGYVYVQKLEYTNLPTTVYVNSTHSLHAKVVPDYVHNNEIEWSVVSGNATIDDYNKITFNAVGEVKIKATVKNGGYPDTDYSETHTIKVLSVTDYDVKNFDGQYWNRLYIKYTSGDTYTVEVGGQSSEVSLDTAVSLKGTFKKKDGETAYGIYIEGFTAENPLNLKLDNLDYTAADGAVIDIKDSAVNLTISGTNVLTAKSGAIYVNSNSKLTIDGNGFLKADSSSGENYAGIGSGYNSTAGEIIINSGTIEAKGGKSAAGIGGGCTSSAGKITINGGNITAIGCEGSNTNGAAAGIGGGASGNCGTLIINGGTVNATGGDYGNRQGGPGIGNGSGGKGGTITINGGNVTATGKSNAAGIGGGAYKDNYNGGSVDSITITGGTINATGNYLGAGIGGGMYYSGGKITITGGNIKASGKNAVGSGGNTNLTTSVVDADGNNVSLVTITLDGATANTVVTKLNGVTSYGLNDVVTLDTNKVYCYISSENNIESVTAGGIDYICKDSSNTYYTAHDWQNKDGVCTRCGEICNHPKDTDNVCDTCGKRLHVHAWRYTTSSGITRVQISATCDNKDGYCDNTDGGSVTVQLKNYYYTGMAHILEIEDKLADGLTYSIIYDAGTEVPSAVGRHYIFLSVINNGNNVAGANGNYNISYLPAPENAYTIVNGYKSESVYWYKDGDKIKIAAPEGYTISATLGGTYGELVELSENDDKVIYLKNADGEMTDAISISETISFDKIAPTGKLEIDDRGFWQKLLNKISFGLFFKGDTVANVTTSDEQSGVKQIEYYIADKDLIADDTLDAANAIEKLENAINGSWIAYDTKITLNKNAKNVIYVKITDNVGNITYINSEGIVIYTDAKVYMASMTVTYKEAKDSNILLKPNGNTVKSLANGDTLLTLGEQYTVDGDKIILKADYLNSLNGGNYKFTVTYNPLGLDYVDNDVNDKPKTTTFTLNVKAAKGSVSDISDISKTYDAVAVENPTFTSLSKGEVTYEYKAFDADDSTYTTVAPKDAGKYVVRVTVAADGNYREASETATFTISKAKVSVKADDKSMVYGDNEPVLTWTLTSGTVYGTDKLNITLDRTKGIDVDEYTVTASAEEGANPNYDITFATGVFEITKRTIGIEWGNTSFVYDTMPKLPTATPTNVAYNDEIAFTVVGEKTEAGINYVATVTAITGDKNSNYNLPENVTVTFVINKASQKAPDTLVGVPETVDGRENGIINGLTDKMEYRKDDSDKYISVSGTVLENLADGTYYVRYAEDANHNASPDTVIVLSNDKKLSVKIPAIQVGYTLTVDKTLLKWNESFKITFTLKEGYSKLGNFAVKVNGNKVVIGKDGSCTVANAQTDFTVTVEGVADVTAPTASVILGESKWNKFFNSVTFGLFFKNTQEVEIVAEDKGSGLDKIYYYLATESLTEQDVINISADKWIEYNGKFSINPQEKYIIYAKVTDKDKNTVYISSEHGIIVDTIAPVISGITDGETYYGNTSFEVIDTYIDCVTVDGESVSLTDGKYTLVADGKEHTVVAVDKSGNSKTVKITVITIASLDDNIEDITKDNVKSSDKQNIQDVLDFVNSLIDSGKEFTDTEKEQLADIKANAEDLIEKIEDVSSEINGIETKVNGYDKNNITSEDKKNIQDIIERIMELNKTENLTEDEKSAMEDIKSKAEGLIKSIEDISNDIKDITDKVDGLDKDNVKTDDKSELEQAKDELEKSLDDYGDNLTEDEKKDIQENIDRINDALDVIEKTENVEDLINKIPSDIKKGDSDTIKAADDSYNNLTDYEQSILDKDTKQKLEDAKTELEKINRIRNICFWIVLVVCVVVLVGVIFYIKNKKHTSK